MIINSIALKIILAISTIVMNLVPNIGNKINNRYLEVLKEQDRTYHIQRMYSDINIDIDHLLHLISLSYEYGIDPDLVLAVIEVESSYNPNAKNKHSSATGYGQIIKSTGKFIAEKIIIEDYNHEVDALDPYLNIHMTVYYIKRCINGSKNSITNALKLYRGKEDIPYFNKVLSIRERIKRKKAMHQ